MEKSKFSLNLFKSGKLTNRSPFHNFELTLAWESGFIIGHSKFFGSVNKFEFWESNHSSLIWMNKNVIVQHSKSGENLVRFSDSLALASKSNLVGEPDHDQWSLTIPMLSSNHRAVEWQRKKLGFRVDFKQMRLQRRIHHNVKPWMGD